MWNRSLPLKAGVGAVLPGCASQGEWAIVLSPVHGQMANVADYRGVDAQARLMELASDFCDSPVHVVGQSDSDDFRSHGLTFECEAATP